MEESKVNDIPNEGLTNHTTGLSQNSNGQQSLELPYNLTSKVKETELKLGKFIYDQVASLNENVLVYKDPVEIDNEAIYVGQWSPEGLRYGKGVQIWKDGSKYEGYWVNDKQSGKGRMIKTNGDFYEGEILNGLRHGQGKYVFTFCTYIGEWKENRMDGNGKLQLSNGEYYEGTFLSGKKHGFGKLYSPVYGYYIGEFLNDYKHGKGIVYTFEEKIFYEGEMKYNEQNGVGSQYQTIDGSLYIGQLYKSSKQGKGEITYLDGKMKRGRWKLDILLGIGLTKPSIGNFQKVKWGYGQPEMLDENE